VCEILGEADIAHHPCESGDEPRRLDSPDRLDGAVRIDGHAAARRLRPRGRLLGRRLRELPDLPDVGGEVRHLVDLADLDVSAVAHRAACCPLDRLFLHVDDGLVLGGGGITTSIMKRITRLLFVCGFRESEPRLYSVRRTKIGEIDTPTKLLLRDSSLAAGGAGRSTIRATLQPCVLYTYDSTMRALRPSTSYAPRA